MQDICGHLDCDSVVAYLITFAIVGGAVVAGAAVAFNWVKSKFKK